MSIPILTTKLYRPFPRLELVFQPYLVEQSIKSLRGGRLTVISTPLLRSGADSFLLPGLL
jgi:hypothetical protein